MINKLKENLKLKQTEISILYFYVLFYSFTSIYRELTVESLLLFLLLTGFLYVFFNKRAPIKSSLIFICNALFYFISFYYILLLSFNSFNYEFINKPKHLSDKDMYYISKINEAKKINMYLDIYKSYKLYISYNNIVSEYFDKLNKETIENDFVNKVINLEFEKYKITKGGLIESKHKYTDKLFLLLDSIIEKGEKGEISVIEKEFLIANMSLYFTTLRHNNAMSDIDKNKRVESIKTLNRKLNNKKINKLLSIYNYN